MRRQELLETLRAQPFKPIRMHVSAGASYDVRHPDLVMVTPSSVLVGSPEANQPPAAEGFTLVDLLHITRLGEIKSPASSS